MSVQTTRDPRRLPAPQSRETSVAHMNLLFRWYKLCRTPSLRQSASEVPAANVLVSFSVTVFIYHGYFLRCTKIFYTRINTGLNSLWFSAFAFDNFEFFRLILAISTVLLIRVCTLNKIIEYLAFLWTNVTDQWVQDSCIFLENRFFAYINSFSIIKPM